MKSPVILFAHGAGAPSGSPWMRRWTERLGRIGTVEPFDYPYMKAGRKAPDRLPKLIAAHEEALAAARDKHGSDRPFFLAGKSMGSRVGCHLAVERAQRGEPPAGLICFGYPLRAVGSGAMRDEVLRKLTVPIAFLQGSRDALCPLDRLEEVRTALTVANELCIVEGGDHSLALRRKKIPPGERTQQDWDDLVFTFVSRFVDHVLGRSAQAATPLSGSS